MTAISTVFAKLRLDTSNVKNDAEKGLKGARLDQIGEGEGKKLADGISRGTAGISFAGIIKSAAPLVALLGAGAGGLAGLAAATGIKTAAGLEQAQIGFSTLLGSGEKAKAFLGNLSKFAAATPFELNGLIDSSRLLLGVGLSADKVIPTLTAFGDAAGAVGVGQENFQRIMLATSQAISAGRFMTEDLNQITENGIPIWRLLSEAMGKPVPVLRDMASAGDLLSKDVLPLLEKQMEKDYGGSMARQSQTLAGVWSTLKDSVTIGLANALQPLVPILTDALPRGADLVSRGLQTVSGWIQSTITWTRDQAIPTLRGFADLLKTGFTEGASSSSGVLQQLGADARVAFDGISALAGGFRTGKSDGDGFKGGMADIGVALRGVADFITGTAIPALVDLGGWLFSHRDLVLGLAIAYGSWKAALLLQAGALAIANGYTAIANGLTAAHTVVLEVNSGARALNNSLLFTWIGVKALELGAWISGTAATVGSTVATAANSVARGINTAAIFVATGGLTIWLGTKAAELGAWIAGTAATIAATVAAGAHATIMAVVRGATIAWTAVQWLLNVALSANPIGLVVIAIGLLVGAIVLAWIKSEGFRNVVISVWNAIRTGIGDAWNWVRDNVFTPLTRFITDTIPNAFHRGVDAITNAWNRVRDAARQPVAFVVNQVINPLLGGFSKVAGFFGIHNVPTAIPGFEEGGRILGTPSMRDNRVARGPGGKALAVATGEFLVNAPQTAKWLPVLEAINSGHMPTGSQSASAYRDSYATGGLVGGIMDFGKDLLGVLTDPTKAIGNFANAAINRIPGGGLFRDMLVGMGTRLKDGIIDKVKGLFSIGAGGIAGNASPGFPPWPSSPAAQRGDSGVWRNIVALINSTGPLSGSFGNAYRPGDPLWHGCVPMDTRILTRRGWLTYDELVAGEDETIGYNPATGKNEWTLIVGLHHYADTEVWTLQNKWFTAEVTPGHKWLVDQQVTVQTETVCTECGREFVTGRGMTKHRADVHGVLTPRRERFEEQLVATRDFKQSTRIHLSKPADLGGQLPITDDEAELIGWIFADGYMEPYGPTIVQSKPEEVQYLRAFMAKFPHSVYRRPPKGRQTHAIFRFALTWEYWQDLSSRSKATKAEAMDFVLGLSVSQRAAFLRGFLSADGTRDPRTQNERLGYAAFQVSGPVAEAIKVAAYLEGYRPDTRVKTEFDKDRFGTQPMEYIGFRTPIVKGRHLPVVDKRTAAVWCPTTTLGTWTARQGEEIFLTGNSGRAVDWMGFNQDALASFFMARRGSVLELIHRTNKRDYAVTRGRDMGSFNNQLMNEHRNHIHIAMANGGLVPETGSRVATARAAVADTGELDLAPGWNATYNGTRRTEHLSTRNPDVVDRLERLIDAVERVAPGVGKEINRTGRSMLQIARAT